jgi:hypothetical protein
MHRSVSNNLPTEGHLKDRPKEEKELKRRKKSAGFVRQNLEAYL